MNTITKQQLKHLEDNYELLINLISDGEDNPKEFEHLFAIEILGDEYLQLSFVMEEIGCCGSPDYTYYINIPEKYLTMTVEEMTKLWGLRKIELKKLREEKLEKQEKKRQEVIKKAELATLEKLKKKYESKTTTSE